MSDTLNIAEQISISVSLAEGQFREFKSAYEGPPEQKKKRPIREISKDVGEALVAFANADGGELLIGVEDDGTVTGTNEFSESEISLVKAACTTHVHADTPLSALCREADIKGKRVIYFRVGKGSRLIHLTSSGRCLRRIDLASVPVAVEDIQFSKREIASREYDREFVDGASVADLDADILRAVATHVSPGISVDKCLQYLGLAEYDGATGLRLRRAAVLLFAKTPDRWHPRVQIRIMKVNGTSVGTGAAYNVVSDNTVKENIIKLIGEAWDGLRPHLASTKFDGDARFRTAYIYPETACREALVNAIAHRDYSDEGRGVEIYVFDDRIEVQSPGELLSSISLKQITALAGAHESRNAYVARTLREMGYMRELGEGMRRIFEVMKDSELAPPEITSVNSSFALRLHHRPMYAREEILWLEQYTQLELSAEEKAAVLLGRRGDLIAPNDILRRLGIVDTEHYRQVVASLQDKGVIETAVSRDKAAQLARSKGVGARDIPRFKVRLAKDIVSQAVSRRHKRGKKKAPQLKQILPAIDVSKHVVAEENPPGVYIANIPPNTTERDLAETFGKFGALANVRVPRAGNLSKGYAFVEFEEASSMATAIAATVVLGGRKLVIRKLLRP